MSVIKIRERLGARMRGEESGFTLVELLVVMLILGLLAAIAIPAFFNQRDKARDADAKSAARTAQTAIETFATDHGGSYAEADGDADALKEIEPTLNNALSLTVVAEEKSYTVVASSETGNRFGIVRVEEGETYLICEDKGEAGCPDTGRWDGKTEELENISLPAAEAGGGDGG